jgi:hypothetical protein
MSTDEQKPDLDGQLLPTLHRKGGNGVVGVVVVDDDDDDDWYIDVAALSLISQSAMTCSIGLVLVSAKMHRSRGWNHSLR